MRVCQSRMHFLIFFYHNFGILEESAGNYEYDLWCERFHFGQVGILRKDNFESYTLNSWSCAPKFRRYLRSNVWKRMPHRKVNHHWYETLEKLFLIDLKTSIFVAFFHKYSFESYTLNMWSCAPKFHRQLRSNVCNGKPYRSVNICWYKNFPNHILNR